MEESQLSCEPIRNFLEARTSYNHQPEHADVDFCPVYNVSKVDCKYDIKDASSKCFEPEEMENVYTSPDKSGEVEGDDADKYHVPLSLIERWGSAMDIVYPDSMRCCCFTKSYYRYVKGAGSLLATCEIPSWDKKHEVCSLRKLGLRYFTPREVANMHSFPEDFHFPPHISIRQQYALLGNSLSIAVVAPLFQYLFMEPT